MKNGWRPGTGIVLAMVTVLVAAGGWIWLTFANSDILRETVLGQCVPGERERQSPAPCEEVNLAKGYAVFKDRNGPLQYLLVPTWKINGIESPLLLNPHTENFFLQAWHARRFLSERYGMPVPDSAVALTINSRSGRMLNHLHIHISCLRLEVRRQLDANTARISSQWLTLPGRINGHDYLARRVTEAELVKRSPFLMLAEEVEGAREHMGRYALALAQQPDGAFVLLATRRNLLRFNLASSDEIQDHDCEILSGPGQA